MAHQSLYRRYRPQRFSEVRGQAGVTDALRAAVADERVGHAYMFSGPRGTGKTSTARILAKALNCEDLHDGEPCGACASCTAMQDGTSYDLQELDAASNNKVEDVRSLIERVALGSPGRTKVYILDEVHMLSPGASNALLKTLEEPPDHVVFVLATTDPQKVLPTIRSRTQHFEFHLLPAEDLADHVRWVIDDAGLSVDDDAVEHVLRAGGGSARDTLSFLDQAAAGGVSAAADHTEALVAAVVGVDTAAALTAVAEATIAGRDPRVLGEGLLGHLRDVFLQRMGGPLGHLSDAARDRVAGWADAVTDRAVTRALEEVGEALLAMRQAPDPRIPLEVALMRITRPAATGASDASAAGADLADLVARVERLERGAAGPAPGAATPTADRPSGTPKRPVTTRGDDGDDARSPVADDPPADGGRDTGARPAVSGRAAARAAVGSARGGAPSRAGASEPDPAPPPPPPASTAPPTPGAPSPAPEPPPGTPSPVDRTRSAQPEPQPEPERAPESAAEPEPRAAAVDQAPEPAVAGLAGLWEESALPGLRGMAKALFKLGRVVSVGDDTLTLGLPNRTHMDRCEEKRGEAEQALSEAAGRSVRLVLVVGGDDGRGDEGDGRGGGGGGRPPDPGPSGGGGNDPFDEPIDPDELVDAPDNRLSGVDRVTEAFPGAQIVDT